MNQQQTPQQPVEQQPVIDRLLVDIPFVNPFIWIRVRIPIIEKAKNIKEKDKYLYQSGIVPGTDSRYIKLDIIQPLIFVFIKDFSSGHVETITMNSFHLMRFKNALRESLVNIQTKNLYYYMDGRLKINDEIANSLKIDVPIFKTMTTIQYTVVSKINESTNIPIEYEGVSISINSSSINFLTIDEIQNLYETLQQINPIELSILASKYVKPMIFNQ